MKKTEININAYPVSNQDVEGAPRRRASVDAKRRRSVSEAQGTTRKKPKTKLHVVIAALTLLCICAGLLVWMVFDYYNQGMLGDDDISSAMAEKIDDKVTVLLLGRDRVGVNTDTIMLAMLDCKEHTINLLSVPRDTRVRNPYGGNGYMKINSVYGAKGIEGIVNEVTNITGIPVNHYVLIDYSGFSDIIDVLGGVDFDVPMDMKYVDPYQDLYIDLKKGMQHLDGDEAEQLVRFRYGYAMADLTRTEVQRDFIKATIEQHATVANVFKVKELFKTVSEYMETDIRLSEAVKYFAQVAKVESANIYSYILPGAAYNFYIYDKEAMAKLADEIFWHNVADRPENTDSYLDNETGSYGGQSKPTKTPEPTETEAPEETPEPDTGETPEPEDESENTDDEIIETPEPKPTSEPEPTPEPEDTYDDVIVIN